MHWLKDDCPGECCRNKDDMSSISGKVREQNDCGDGTVVNERKTESEQEIERRAVNEYVETISPIIAPGASNEEAQERREQDKRIIGMRYIKNHNE